jgi:sortase A
LSTGLDGAKTELAPRGVAENRRGRAALRVVLRGSGILLALGGLITLAWVITVWQWQDPVTLVLNKREQARLSSAYEERVTRVHPKPAPVRPSAEALAAFYRRSAVAYRQRTGIGDPIGKLIVPRLGLHVVVVLGTDTESLKKGPGLHPPTGFPGQGRLTYVAGHRTTYGAPFSDIDKLESGDRVTFEVPYGTFQYVVTGHRIVRANQLEVLRSRGREEIALQACWPRFFASHRYIAYAKLVRVAGPSVAG